MTDAKRILGSSFKNLGKTQGQINQERRNRRERLEVEAKAARDLDAKEQAMREQIIRDQEAQQEAQQEALEEEQNLIEDQAVDQQYEDEQDQYLMEQDDPEIEEVKENLELENQAQLSEYEDLEHYIEDLEQQPSIGWSALSKNDHEWIRFFDNQRDNIDGLTIDAYNPIVHNLSHLINTFLQRAVTVEDIKRLDDVFKSGVNYVMRVDYVSGGSIYIPMTRFSNSQYNAFTGVGIDTWLEYMQEEGSDPNDMLSEALVPTMITFSIIGKGVVPDRRLLLRNKSKSKSKSRSRSLSRPKVSGKQTERGSLRSKQASILVRSKYYRNSNNVAFFPYINNSNIDLEYAQIYTTGQQEQSVEHCLISTLRFFGIEDAILSNISFRLVGHTFHIPRKDFAIVCELADVNFYLTMFNNNTEMKRRSFNVKNKNSTDKTVTIHAGLFMDHIFPNVDTKFSMFFVRNLKAITALSDKQCNGKALKIVKFRKGKPIFGEPRVLDTLGVIRELFIGGYFTESSSIERIQLASIPILTPVGLANEQEEYEGKPKSVENKQKIIGESIYFAADLESYVHGIHKCCLAAVCVIPQNTKMASEELVNHVTLFDGIDPVRDLFKFIINKIRKTENTRRIKFAKRVVYFHNLRYDRTLFESNPILFLQSITTKDNNIYSIKLRCMGVLLEIRDSLKMIPVGISKFAKTFDLPSSMNKKSDLILYDFFKPENFINTFRCTTAEYAAEHKFAEGEDESNSFIEQLNMSLLEIPEVKFNRSNDTFYPKALYMYYLKFDVAILAAGLSIFRSQFNELSDGDLDVFDSLTISSYAYKHMGMYGAFNGVFSVSGNLRTFLSEAIYGGRVLCNPLYEGTRVTNTELDYFDACSLYPSAIRYICSVKGGFPTGPALVIPVHLKNYVELTAIASEFTVRINITRIERKQFSIPFIAYRNEGRLDYIQEIPDGLTHITVVVDKQTLEDYLQYHEIQFDIVEGVYWKGDLNPEWGNIVETLYEARLIAKSEGKSVKADCIKLILNSAYGKTITRASNTSVTYIPKMKDGCNKNWKLSIVNAFNVIQKYREVGINQVEVTKFQLDKSFNISKYGSMILAASKHIMNEVFDLMSENEMPIYYTDTDSFVMRKQDRESLSIKFQQKFERKLIGKQLGNFHSDFSFKLNGKEIDPSIVTSVEFIPAGRKLYLHHLIALVDNREYHSLQFKAKGCTVEGMWDAAARYGPGDAGMIQLYRHLTYGDKIKITLNPVGKKVKFVYDRFNSVTTPDILFVREICSQAARQSKLGDDEVDIDDADDEELHEDTVLGQSLDNTTVLNFTSE